MSNPKASELFKVLLDTTDTLMGPTGCPWDREQTLISMRESILEEACEVIEAVDEGSDKNLIEELGDLLYNIIFFCKLAEKEGRFLTAAPIQHIQEKLITRHPHVFGNQKIETMQAVISQWEAIKKEEKKERESLMDGIPKGLPSLDRAYKIAGKMERAGFDQKEDGDYHFENETDLGELLWQIVSLAKKRGLNPEIALRKTITQEESAFRHWEEKNKTPPAS